MKILLRTSFALLFGAIGLIILGGKIEVYEIEAAGRIMEAIGFIGLLFYCLWGERV